MRSVIITKASLLAAQSQDLCQVVELLRVNVNQARSLLIHYRWNVESLSGRLGELGVDKVFQEAGIPLRTEDDSDADTPTIDAPSTAAASKDGHVYCKSCMDETAIEESTTMDCGHIFCNDCWMQYFLIKIKEGQSRRITCMDFIRRPVQSRDNSSSGDDKGGGVVETEEVKCNAICDEEHVRRLVGAVDRDMLERYERSLLESYIEDNNKVKWCPSVPHCGNAIQVDGEPYCELECVCGRRFCFNCLADPHSPSSCYMWALWERKCKDESETLNWMHANTKTCPKCQKPVEKNGGCNLVTCVCGQAFCWLCGCPTGREHTWTNIAGHNCGRYKDEKEVEAKRAERDLKRYLHYHNFWKGHMDSLKLEEKQKAVVHEKIAKLEESESMVKDYTWLTNALQVLFRTRRVLAYSYVFAFYMFGNDLFKDEITREQNNINQNLFEDRQMQLEESVELLSKLVNFPIDLHPDDNRLQAVRMQVVNLVAKTETLCNGMYEIVEKDLLGSLQHSSHHIARYKPYAAEQLVHVAISSSYLQGSENGVSCGSGSVVEVPALCMSLTESRSGLAGNASGPSARNEDANVGAATGIGGGGGGGQGQSSRGVVMLTEEKEDKGGEVVFEAELPRNEEGEMYSRKVQEESRVRRERALKRPAAEVPDDKMRNWEPDSKAARLSCRVPSNPPVNAQSVAALPLGEKDALDFGRLLGGGRGSSRSAADLGFKTAMDAFGFYREAVPREQREDGVAQGAAVMGVEDWNAGRKGVGGLLMPGMGAGMAMRGGVSSQDNNGGGVMIGEPREWTERRDRARRRAAPDGIGDGGAAAAPEGHDVHDSGGGVGKGVRGEAGARGWGGAEDGGGSGRGLLQSGGGIPQCPVCMLFFEQSATNDEINSHVDEVLRCTFDDLHVIFSEALTSLLTEPCVVSVTVSFC
ncbi:hypothetical protein CBR_g3160 [Chara braunii]|uniref:RBR-type E3 ubiquitin transferase n=1 Tax=Chara braunii TaxID=69332 RepID=A0A388KEZ3_CHABU|nr:hypothetical protein CBR_g3160 [Chara braunii]|eukprot:GBG68619.1 hypothetical protein CBR_g3160 [Chara braunii]